MVFRSKYGAQIIMTPTYIMPPKPSAEAEAERCARTGVADEGRAGAFAGSVTRAGAVERVRSGWS